MKKNIPPANSIPVYNKYRKVYLPVSEIKYAISKGRRSLVAAANGNVYLSPVKIQTMGKLYSKLGLLIIHRSRMVNLNYVIEDEKHPFEIDVIPIKDGSELWISKRVARKLKRECRCQRWQHWQDVLRQLGRDLIGG